MKKCSKCGETKALELFSRKTASSDGRDTRCRACKKIADRYRRSNAYKDVIILAKNVPCLDCGVSYPPYVMDFDHRPEEVKSFSIGSGGPGRALYSLKKEIAKCDVVCANCHRIRTYERRNINP